MPIPPDSLRSARETRWYRLPACTFRDSLCNSAMFRRESVSTDFFATVAGEFYSPAVRWAGACMYTTSKPQPENSVLRRCRNPRRLHPAPPGTFAVCPATKDAKFVTRSRTLNCMGRNDFRPRIGHFPPTRFPVFHSPLFAPGSAGRRPMRVSKGDWLPPQGGSQSIAQGNALGNGIQSVPALKGRNSWCGRRSYAPSGLRWSCGTVSPGRCPGLLDSCPFGAQYRLTHWHCD
jgi:hypothetical protein